MPDGSSNQSHEMFQQPKKTTRTLNGPDCLVTTEEIDENSVFLNFFLASPGRFLKGGFRRYHIYVKNKKAHYILVEFQDDPIDEELDEVSYDDDDLSILSDEQISYETEAEAFTKICEEWIKTEYFLRITK